jgi:transcriptional regulator with XRE-family HTH domain
MYTRISFLVHKKEKGMPTLRQLREKHYISRKKLVLLSGVSESTIIRMEKGGHYLEENVTKILAAISKEIGQEISRDSIEGLSEPYNPMRDRKQKSEEDPAA